VSAQSPTTPRRQINSATPFLDAGFLYGTQKAVTDTLRTYDNTGQLRSRKSATSGADLPPIAKSDTSLETTLHNPLELPASLLRETANRRANQNPATFAVQTLWLREHNRRAKEIRAADVDGKLSGTQVFERARAWVVAMFQNIVLHELLPILGICLLEPDDVEYDADIVPHTSSAFALAGSQFDQFMTDEGVPKLSKVRVSRDGSASDATAQELPTCNSAFMPSRYEAAVGSTDGVDAIAFGLLSTPARLPGLHVAKSRRSFGVSEAMIKVSGIKRQDQGKGCGILMH
jgi:peroxidase